MLEKLSLFLNTIKHLRFKQIYYRLYYRFTKVKVKPIDFYLPLCEQLNFAEWKGNFFIENSLINNSRATFLNKERDISLKDVWNDANAEKLWLYNLHYMDYLNTKNSLKNVKLQKSLVLRWINENPAVEGNGWEPYPLSLRIVNLIKWCRRNKEADSLIIGSLYQQVHALSQRVEYHILANHIFANAKALLFAGDFFENDFGMRCKKQALKILDKECSEQFLKDGGHFERSPMYHSVMLWDLLDLICLSNQSGVLSRYNERWRETAKKSLSWLNAMIHPDGEVSFFNDGAMGVAPKAQSIFDYAAELGIDSPQNDSSQQIKVQVLKYSGFSVANRGLFKLIFNHAEIGPSYQPGHAHADTLSFELSIGEERIFVNSGTSCYGNSLKRQKERSTAAHNTVVINNQDSSEVWDGFRVAKRAKVFNVINEKLKNFTVFEAHHDGYARLYSGLTHKRKIKLDNETVEISDFVNSKKYPVFVNYYLHPFIKVHEVNQRELILNTSSNRQLTIKSTGDIKVEASEWHPQFGMAVKNIRLKILFELEHSLRIGIKDTKDI